jgi:uronate dehydrogenase
MRILITGAAGRIGRTLAQGLGGHDLRLTDIQPPAEMPPGAELLLADLTQADAVRPLVEGMDAVIHMAGHPNSRDWALVERLNIGGTRAVIEAAALVGVPRVIIASSVHAVGTYPSDVRLTDSMPLRPDCPYGVSKAANELTLQYHCERFGLTGFALRICSFRPAPADARQLRLWLSHPDMVRLTQACLTTDATGYHMIWGLSANTRLDLVSDGWARIGYAPQDNAEDHLAALHAQGVDTSIVSEWPMLGGAFASA